MGRERQLVPDRAKWPAKLNVYQGVTLAGLGWLVLACTGLPLTFGKEADLLSHALLLFMAAGLIACTGIGLVIRYGPKLIKGPGFGAAVPGIAAGLIALVVWQGQGPVASYYFAGPYERYEREYANGCLAASPTGTMQSRPRRTAAYSSSPPSAERRRCAWGRPRTAAPTRLGRWTRQPVRSSTGTGAETGPCLRP